MKAYLFTFECIDAGIIDVKEIGLVEAPSIQEATGAVAKYYAVQYADVGRARITIHDRIEAEIQPPQIPMPERGPIIRRAIAMERIEAGMMLVVDENGHARMWRQGDDKS